MQYKVSVYILHFIVRMMMKRSATIVSRLAREEVRRPECWTRMAQCIFQYLIAPE